MAARFNTFMSKARPPWAINLLLGLLSIAVSACTPDTLPQSTSPWSFDQIRVLDPVHQDTHIGDIIALYSRQTNAEIQFRIDLLELEIGDQADISVEIIFVESTDIDLTIFIPSDGAAEITAPQYSVPPLGRVIRDPVLDFITISLNSQFLPKKTHPFSMRVTSSYPGQSKIIDSVVASSNTAVKGRVPLVLAFWNTLPAHTPAQALRRWDGAHTGPLGQRHGLVHLLDAVKRYQVPLILLDIKTPLSLSALDILDQRKLLQNLSSDNLALLPDVLPEPYFGLLPVEINQKVAKISREIATNFQIANGSWNYAPALPDKSLSRYSTTLTLQPASLNSVLQVTDIYRWGNQRLLPVPLENSTAEQVTDGGLNLAIRRALLTSAVSAEKDPQLPIAILGGNLPHTNWGDAKSAPIAIAYIAAHPWIHPLTEKDLNARAARVDYTASANIETRIDLPPALKALQQAPPGPITDLAWQAALAALAPADPTSPNLAPLRAHYLGVIGNLLAASAWQNGKMSLPDTAIIQDCSLDTDYDSQPECILASENFFAIIDLHGGLLSLAFFRTPSGVHQIIAPTSQFAVGISDSNLWDFSRVNPDPGVIPGAFSGPQEPFTFSIIPNGLQLISPTIQKEYSLLDNGLQVKIQTSEFVQVHIPLAIDSSQRFSPGWASLFEERVTPKSWSWGTKQGPKVEIRTNGTLTTNTFLTSLPIMNAPENPNLDYPPGYFIPLPMAVASITSPESFWVTITLLDIP